MAQGHRQSALARTLSKTNDRVASLVQLDKAAEPELSIPWSGQHQTDLLWRWCPVSGQASLSQLNAQAFAELAQYRSGQQVNVLSCAQKYPNSRAWQQAVSATVTQLQTSALLESLPPLLEQWPAPVAAALTARLRAESAWQYPYVAALGAWRRQGTNASAEVQIRLLTELVTRLARAPVSHPHQRTMLQVTLHWAIESHDGQQPVPEQPAVAGRLRDFATATPLRQIQRQIIENAAHVIETYVPR